MRCRAVDEPIVPAPPTMISFVSECRRSMMQQFPDVGQKADSSIRLFGFSCCLEVDERRRHSSYKSTVESVGPGPTTQMLAGGAVPCHCKL